jgi:hypothetical protein
VLNTQPSATKIVAHLAPDDDAEIEARIAERLEKEMKDNANIIVATQVTKDQETLLVCGLPKETVWTLIVFLLLVVGGIVGGVVYSLENDDPVAPTQLDALLQELKPWIAPTEDDLLPFNNTASPQSLALMWLKDDPIAMSKDRDTSVVLQRYILAVVYYSTFGDGWYESYNFVSDVDVCMWNNGTPISRPIMVVLRSFFFSTTNVTCIVSP